MSLSGLLHLAWKSLGAFMLLQRALFHPFLWLNNILLYIYTTSSDLSLCWWYLGCFHVLVIVYSAAVNIGVHVSFYFRKLWFSLNISPGVGLLNHMVALFLVFRSSSFLAVCCHPVCLVYMLSTSWEMPGWISYKLESR